MDVQLVVQQQNIRELARLERAIIVLHADRAGRIGRGRTDGLPQWYAILTALRTQSSRLVAEPAIVPSCSVARLPRTVTACPPSEYSPSSRPVAIMLSEISITRFQNILNVARTTAGWICTPSAISSTATSSLSAAAR